MSNHCNLWASHIFRTTCLFCTKKLGFTYCNYKRDVKTLTKAYDLIALCAQRKNWGTRIMCLVAAIIYLNHFFSYWKLNCNYWRKVISLNFKPNKITSYEQNRVSIYLFKFNDEKTPEQCKTLIKVDKKDTRTTLMASLWCLFCWLWTDFTHCSGVSIVDFQQASAGWDINIDRRGPHTMITLNFVRRWKKNDFANHKNLNFEILKLNFDVWNSARFFEGSNL